MDSNEPPPPQFPGGHDRVGPVPPPPAPDVPTGDPVAPPWLAWLVIIVSTVYIGYAASRDAEEPEEAPAGEETVDVGSGSAASLAVLKLQARSVLGGAQLPGGDDLSVVVDELRQSVVEGSDQEIVAVAALEHFASLKGEESTGNATQAIREALTREQADIELLETALLAIESPAELTPELWTWLTAEIGWFAELLQAADGGPDEASQDEIYADSQRFAAVLLYGIISLCGAGLVGVILLTVGLVKSSEGKLVPGIHPLPTPRAGRRLVEGFAVYLGLMAGLGLLGDWWFSQYAPPPGEEPSAITVALVPIVAIASLVIPVVVAVAWIFRRRNREPGMARALGWHRGRGLIREVFSGLVGYVAILPVVAIGIATTILLTVIMEFFAADPNEAEAPITHPIVEWMAAGDLGVMILALLMAAVAAPLFEETLFRGAFHGGMRSRWSFWLSASISALVFAAVHPQGWMAIPALGAMGLGFAMIREWRGSLIAPMTAHALHNGMLVGAMWLAFAS